MRCNAKQYNTIQYNLYLSIIHDNLLSWDEPQFSYKIVSIVTFTNQFQSFFEIFSLRMNNY